MVTYMYYRYSEHYDVTYVMTGWFLNHLAKKGGGGSAP